MTHHDDPQRMSRGTYPVELRCLCRGNGRYFSVKCPDVAAHGVWAEQDWYGTPPVFVDPVMEGAKEYHAAYMAEVARLRALRDAS